MTPRREETLNSEAEMRSSAGSGSRVPWLQFRARNRATAGFGILVRALAATTMAFVWFATVAQGAELQFIKGGFVLDI